MMKMLIYIALGILLTPISASAVPATLAPAIAFYSHFIIAGQNEYSPVRRVAPKFFILFFAKFEFPYFFEILFLPEMGPQMKIMRSLEPNSVQR